MNAITKKLNTITASSLVLYTKLHNYHWNVKGFGFYVVHEKTEELYQHFATVYDDAAERTLQLNDKPVVTMKQTLEMSKIEEDSKTDFNTEYVFKNILSDFNTLLVEFKELAELAEDDATTAAFADDNVAFLEKEIWMLKANLNS